MTILASAILSLTVATGTGDGARDFDFLMGQWKIQNRRLRERLKGSTEWDEFEATHVARPLPNDLGNQDEYRTNYWPDFVGMSFRFFNPATKQWSIYWADSRRRVLDPPVVGSFAGDAGIFEGTDTFENRPIRVRFTWSRVNTGTPRWEQAFSDDAGTTWETNWVMDFTRVQPGDSGVVELRQYTLKPGRRDDLIALFERQFVESQEAAGMAVIGQFRDRQRADRFVWLRGFANMASRHTALSRFYEGPVWAEHKSAANDTMRESHDVLLLKPARPDTGFRLGPGARPASGEQRSAAVVVAGIHQLRHPADSSIVSLFESTVAPALRDQGVRVDAILVSESSPNTFTRLPVREGEHVLVWFGTLTRGRAPDARRLEQVIGVGPLGDQPPVVLELDPTPRSLYGR